MGFRLIPTAISGFQYVINQSGEFFYDGPVAKGNLILSVAAASGVDPAGNMLLSLSPAGGTDYGNINTVLNGMVSYANVGGTFYAAQVTGQQVVFYTAPSEAGPWTLQTGIRFNLATGMLELGAVGAP